MKLFKMIDILIQLLILFVMAINFFRPGGKDAALICIIVFGAWQVVSSIIHFFLKFKKTWWRLAYSLLGLVILFLMLAIKVNIFSKDDFKTVMLLLAPFMGVYYLILSCVETIKLHGKKDMEHSLIID